MSTPIHASFRARLSSSTLLQDLLLLCAAIVSNAALTCAAHMAHFIEFIKIRGDAELWGVKNADQLIAYLQEHKGVANQSIRDAQVTANRLLWFYKMMPNFISSLDGCVPYMLLGWAALGTLYFRYRHGRFNSLILNWFGVPVYLLVYVAVRPDPIMGLLVCFPWTYTGLTFATVVVHRMLGDKAWKTEKNFDLEARIEKGKA